MYLNPILRASTPIDPTTIMGMVVTATPPTVRRPITGRVIEVDGYSLVLQGQDMIIAVDIEDCDLRGLTA